MTYRGKVFTYGFFVILAIIGGMIAAIAPIPAAILSVSLIVLFLCFIYPNLVLIGVLLSLFIDIPLPVSSQIVNTNIKIAMLLIIFVSILRFPVIWKRTTLIRGWWKLAIFGGVSLIATSVATYFQQGPSFLVSHLYGAESFTAFFLISLYTYSFINDKKGLDSFLNKILPNILTTGLLIRTIPLLSESLSLWSLNKNTFGFLLDIIVPLAWIAVLQKKGKRWSVLLILSMILLIISNSRGSIIGIGFALVCYLIFSKKHTKKTYYSYLFLIIAAFCVIPFIPEEIIQRLLSSTDLQDYTQMSRLQFWDTSLQIIPKYPLFGIGFYNFNYFFQQYFNSYVEFHHPHNSYLNILVGTGVSGFLVFLLSVRYILSKVSIAIKKGIMGNRRYFSGFVLGIIALAVHGMVDTTFLMPQPLLLMGILCGLTLKDIDLANKNSFEGISNKID